MSSVFSRLPDDVVLNVLYKLEDDPRNWARLACACTKFSSLIRNVCWKTKCRNVLPSVVSDLVSSSSSSAAASEPPGSWSSLYKLAVCCPGLLHSGVLFENSDFGLERELGPDDNFRRTTTATAKPQSEDCSWSLYDDLYNDYETVLAEEEEGGAAAAENGVVFVGLGAPVRKRRKICRSMRSWLREYGA